MHPEEPVGPGRRRRPRRASQPAPSAVEALATPSGQIEMRLGNLERDSIAPALYALVDRGALRRPELAASLDCRLELRFKGAYPVVRVTFSRGQILVEDAPQPSPTGAAAAAAEVDSAEADLPAAEPDPDTIERAVLFSPDVVVDGSLPDVVAITASPLILGLPKLSHPRSWSALTNIAIGRVRIRGSPRLVRQILMLLEI